MKVTIKPEESLLVEKLFFEYNASVDVLKFLAGQDNVSIETLKKYNDIIMEKNWELEQAKKAVTSRYQPEGCTNYLFVFEENTIEFT